MRSTVEFAKILDWVNTQLPTNEKIGEAFRKETIMYPKIAISLFGIAN
jgi:hypothetical protein